MYHIRNIENKFTFNNWKFVRIEEHDLIEIDKFVANPDCGLIVNDKNVKEVIAYGDVTGDTTKISIYDFLKQHVPFVERRPAGSVLSSKERIKIYHCFSGSTLESQVKNNVFIHEDVRSSISCLLESLKKPKHLLIYC